MTQTNGKPLLARAPTTVASNVTSTAQTNTHAQLRRMSGHAQQQAALVPPENQGRDVKDVKEVKDTKGTRPNVPADPGFDIDGKHYDLGNRLGSGAFGIVSALTSTDASAKKLVTKRAREGKEASLVNEANIQGSLPEHQHVLASPGTRQNASGQVTDLVLEAASGGDARELSDRLREAYQRNDISHAQFHSAIQYLTRGTARGLAHIHEQKLVHNDIKPENVLLGGEHSTTPKLGDFGLATRAGERQTSGTEGYMSPERRFPLKPPSAAADVYALGQMTHVMATGVSTRDARSELKDVKSGAFGNFVSRTMAADSKTRPEAKTLESHAYLDDPMMPDEDVEELIACAQRNDFKDARKSSRELGGKK